LKWLLQSDWRETFIPSLGREPWVTVYFDKVTEDENLGVFSALIPNAYVETSLSRISWDFHIVDGIRLVLLLIIRAVKMLPIYDLETQMR
jgi:hypothetical protein